MSVLNGCNSSKKEEPITKVVNDYCSLFVAIPEGDEEDLINVPNSIFSNAKVNNTTYVCHCLAKTQEEKQQCWKDFYNKNT